MCCVCARRRFVLLFCSPCVAVWFEKCCVRTHACLFDTCSQPSRRQLTGMWPHVQVSYHAAVELNGNIYTLGGMGTDDMTRQPAWYRDVFCLDPNAGLWTKVKIPQLRRGLERTKPCACVRLALTFRKPPSRFSFLVDALRWQCASMLSKRVFFSAEAVNGRIYAIGGRSSLVSLQPRHQPTDDQPQQQPTENRTDRLCTSVVLGSDHSRFGLQ